MENFQNFLKYMDTFGMKYHFYINKKSKYYSIMGGILSLTAIIISLGIFTFASLRRLSPSITSIIYSDSKNKFEKDKVYLAWKITDENNNFINYSNITINYIPEGGNANSIKVINYKFCNLTAMINITKKNSKIIFSNLGDLFCIDLGDIFNSNYLLSGNIIFNLFFNGNNLSNSLVLKLFYPTIKFDYENFSEPLYNIYQKHYISLDNNLIKNEKIILGEYSVFDKFGFFGNKERVISLWGINFFFTDNLNMNINNKDGNLPIYSLNILLDKKKIEYKRDHSNIFLIFVEIYPICYIILKFAKYLFKYIIEAKANSKIIELLFENKQKESKTDIYKDKIRFKSLAGIQPQNLNKNNTRNNNNLIDNNNNKNCNENNNQKDDQGKSSKKENIIDNNQQKCSEKNVSIPKLVKAVRKKSRRSINFGETSNKNNNLNLLNQNILINKNVDNDNSVHLNESRHGIIHNNKFLMSPTHRHKKKKKVRLFPFKFYFFSTFLKNYDIMNCEHVFSAKFKSVFSFTNQLLDINTYILLKKEVEIMKNLFCSKEDLSLIENKKKININSTKFTREIKDCIENNKFNIFCHRLK
jgi:hypothetical protein